MKLSLADPGWISLEALSQLAKPSFVRRLQAAKGLLLQPIREQRNQYWLIEVGRRRLFQPFTPSRQKLGLAKRRQACDLIFQGDGHRRIPPVSTFPLWSGKESSLVSSDRHSKPRNIQIIPPDPWNCALSWAIRLIECHSTAEMGVVSSARVILTIFTRTRLR